MKRYVLVIAFIVCSILLTITAAAQTPNLVQNGDFEKYSGDTPTGWETSNIPGTLTVVSSTPLGHKGTRGVKCEVKDFYGTKIAGFACQKNISVRGVSLELSGYYLFRSVGKDVAVAILCFQNAAGSTIGTVEEPFREDKPEWTRFVREVDIPQGASTMHVRLTILGDPDTGTLHPGTYAVFDDIRLIAVVPKPKPVGLPQDSAKTQ